MEQDLGLGALDSNLWTGLPDERVCTLIQRTKSAIGDAKKTVIGIDFARPPLVLFLSWQMSPLDYLAQLRVERFVDLV